MTRSSSARSAGRVSMLVLTVAAPCRASVFTSLSSPNDVQYFATLKLGSEETEVALLLDSGSDEVLVFSPDAGLDVSTYFSANSTSATETTDTFSVTYGVGLTCSGNMVTDDVVVQGTSTAITDVSLSVGDSVDSGSWTLDGDGILGLSPSSALLMTMFDRGLIDELGYAISVSAGQESIEFGGYDTSVASESFWFGARQSTTSWFVGITRFAIGPVLWCTNGLGSCYALVDSGTSYLGVPSSIYDEVIASIGVSDCPVVNGAYVCDTCDGGEYQSIDFNVYERSTDYEDLFFKVEIRQEDYMSDSCIVQIQPVDETFFVFGMPLFKAYYMYFDDEEEKIGFARFSNPVDQDLGVSAGVLVTTSDTILIAFSAAVIIAVVLGCYQCSKSHNDALYGTRRADMSTELRRMHSMNPGLRTTGIPTQARAGEDQMPPGTYVTMMPIVPSFTGTQAHYAQVPGVAGAPQQQPQQQQYQQQQQPRVGMAMIQVACPQCTYENNVSMGLQFVTCAICQHQFEA